MKARFYPFEGGRLKSPATQKAGEPRKTGGANRQGSALYAGKKRNFKKRQPKPPDGGRKRV